MSIVAEAMSNPVNLVLTGVLVVLAFQYIFPADPNSSTLRPTVAHARLRMDPSHSYSALPTEHVKATVWNRYTPRTLAVFDGTGKEASDRILLAINGKVFDVTSGRNFYGPDGPYGNFAGRDASRGMAKQSFDADMLTPLDQPIDKLEDLTPSERTNMLEWESHFTGKYGVVGELVNEGAA
ncbi:Dihydrodipicolinate synthase [Malassezia cuniculi]|uniref:Dihydrodipicolinate synthase n=1 Tax=Malassezia cuniculi TaxID=948313 RepID=A0AAF0JAN4_9BASI|nr:Dihydrodipicolinate synthase [Malassezia cuniculi]